MKKLFNLSEVFIIIAITISIYCFSLAISLVYKDYVTAKQTNDFYENIKIGQFNIEKDILLGDKIKELKDMNIKNIMTHPIRSQELYGDIISAIDVRGVEGDYIFKYAKKTEDIDKLKKLFQGEDNVAIIGKGAERYCETINNEKTIRAFDERYKVIAVLDDNLYLKNNIFVPMKQLPFYKRQYNSFTFMFLDEDIDKVKNAKDLTKIEVMPKKSIKEAILKSPKLKGNILNFSVGMLNLMLFSIFYCEKLKKRLAIMRVVGASNYHIIKEIAINYFRLAGISLIIGICLSNATYYFANKIFYGNMSPINYINIGLSILVMFLIIIIVTLFTLINVIKFNVIKEIR